MNLIKIANFFIKKYSSRNVIEEIYNHFKFNNNLENKNNWVNDTLDKINNNLSYSSINKKDRSIELELLNNKNLIISLDRINHKDKTIEGIILGNSSIPTLRYEFIELNNNLNYYDFLLDIIPTLLSVDKNLIYEDLEKIVKNNKSKLDSITSMMEIKPPKYLGKGADGIAYLIAKDKVLKLFLGEESFNQLQNSYNNLFENTEDSKYEPMIYDLGELGKIFGIKIFYVILEKFDTKIDKYSDNELEALSYRIRYLILENINLKLDEIVNIVYNELTDLEVDSYNLIKDTLQIETTLEEYIENMASRMIKNKKDLHVGNLGISERNRKFIFFDPHYKTENRSTNIIRDQLQKGLQSSHLIIKKIIEEVLAKSDDELKEALFYNEIQLTNKLEFDTLYNTIKNQLNKEGIKILSLSYIKNISL